jgi:hypothetical protein
MHGGGDGKRRDRGKIMLTLEEIDAKIKELELALAKNNDLIHKALDARKYEAMQEFIRTSDEITGALDALKWVCGEKSTL